MWPWIAGIVVVGSVAAATRWRRRQARHAAGRWLADALCERRLAIARCIGQPGSAPLLPEEAALREALQAALGQTLPQNPSELPAAAIDAERRLSAAWESYLRALERHGDADTVAGTAMATQRHNQLAVADAVYGDLGGPRYGLHAPPGDGAFAPTRSGRGGRRP